MENNENVKRARNFTDFEKNLLVNIVKKYLPVIENKKTDAKTVKVKNEAWNSIMNEFNPNCQSGHRTAKQLHALYDGMKKKARKSMRQNKVPKEIYTTGGGTFTPTSDTTIIESLAIELKPFSHSYDSSTNYLDQDPLERTEITNMCEQYGEDSESEDCTQQYEMESKQGILVEEPITIGTDAPPLMTKKNTLSTNRLVERKNKKDEMDEAITPEITEKKIRILDIEEAIKTKELQRRSLELEHLELRYKMELEHMKQRHKLELQLLETELNIKKADLKLKE